MACHPDETVRMARTNDGLFVAFWEWIRFDEVGFGDNVELTVRAHFTNASFGPEVTVFVNLDITFRSIGHFDASAACRDLVDVEGTNFFNGGFPQPWAEVSSLGHVTDNGVITPAFFEMRQRILCWLRCPGFGSTSCKRRNLQRFDRQCRGFRLRWWRWSAGFDYAWQG